MDYKYFPEKINNFPIDWIMGILEGKGLAVRAAPQESEPEEEDYEDEDDTDDEDDRSGRRIAG